MRPSRDVTILYHLLTDRFAPGESPAALQTDVDRSDPGAWHGGTWRGIINHLDHIARIADAIWISPVVEQIPQCLRGEKDGVKFRHCAFHGYWAQRFDRANRHFGGISDLRALIDAAHARGLKVLLDVVPNHVGYGALPWVKDPLWTRSVELGTCPAPPADPLQDCLFGLPDLRTESDAVSDAIARWHADWLRESGADGYRIDTAKHVPARALAKLARAARAVKPDAILIGEVWGARPDADGGDVFLVNGPIPRLDQQPNDAAGGHALTHLIDFGFAGLVMPFVQGRGRPIALAHALSLRDRRSMQYAHFLDSHDVDPIDSTDPKTQLAIVLQFTANGIAIVYEGDETGLPRRSWPFNRPDMDWQHADAKVLKLYRTLATLRRRHPALRQGSTTVLASSKDALVLLRAHGKDHVIVALNRGREAIDIDLAFPHKTADQWRDAFDRTRFDSGTKLSIPAITARILEEVKPRP